MASFAEALGEALDGVDLPSGDEPSTEAAAAETTSETVETGSETSGTESGRDEHGRFTAKPAEPEAGKAEAQAEQKPAEPAQDTEGQAASPDARSLATPPATWSAGAKAIYGQLPEVARKEIAKREQDYARGIQQHAEAAKGYQTLMREFQPYEAMIRSENGSPEGAIRELLKTAYALRSGTPQSRGKLVMQIAQQFGADITPFIGQPANQEQAASGHQEFLPQVQQMVQQLVAPHLQKIQSWEQQQTTAQQRHEQQMQQEITSQLEAFQNATAEDGITPKHVYFENVRGLMSAYFANGQAQTLEQAYDMACWANPEVRAALQADMQRSAEAQRLEEAKRKAADAKNASFNVSGQGGIGMAGTQTDSLEDVIAAKLAQQRGGVRV